MPETYRHPAAPPDRYVRDPPTGAQKHTCIV